MKKICEDLDCRLCWEVLFHHCRLTFLTFSLQFCWLCHTHIMLGAWSAVCVKLTSKWTERVLPLHEPWQLSSNIREVRYRKLCDTSGPLLSIQLSVAEKSLIRRGQLCPPSSPIPPPSSCTVGQDVFISPVWFMLCSHLQGFVDQRFSNWAPCVLSSAVCWFVVLQPSLCGGSLNCKLSLSNKYCCCCSAPLLLSGSVWLKPHRFDH